MVKLTRKINPDNDLESQMDALEDTIKESFFAKKYHVQTITGDDFVYIGTVNKFNMPEGVGRLITANNSIHEGSFKNGQATGYGRKIESN